MFDVLYGACSILRSQTWSDVITRQLLRGLEKNLCTRKKTNDMRKVTIVKIAVKSVMKKIARCNVV